ncbi:hypothetical protein RRG08_064979 [Elysia crispata]|uniref:Uncharacterized protein n=1 Tax=Elysia crispata TaxID=231223 RepID=A0AAE0Y9P9_9GAST|nr:hypothetical protein RRG08_064979 [Elysia crispata]
MRDGCLGVDGRRVMHAPAVPRHDMEDACAKRLKITKGDKFRQCQSNTVTTVIVSTPSGDFSLVLSPYLHVETTRHSRNSF